MVESSPGVDGSELASLVLDSVDTLEGLRALVFPLVAVAVGQELRRRAQHEVNLKAMQMAGANARVCVASPDPSNPAVFFVVPRTGRHPPSVLPTNNANEA